MKAKSKRGRGRPVGTTKGKKVPVNIMLPPLTKERLDAMAEQTGITRGALVDQALRAHLRPAKRKAKSKIAVFLAKHPLIPGGNEVLAGLLKEREEST